MRAAAVRVTALCAAIQAAIILTLAAQVPDRTVWDGAFTLEQADRGRMQYASACARCHGGSLEGGIGRRLAGAPFMDRWREQSVGDLLDYLSKSMPMGAGANTLSPSAYADIVAYLLRSNDLPAGTTELTATTATGVRIAPKDGGTGELPDSTLARVIGCLAPRAADGSWRVTTATRPERMKTFDGTVPPNAPPGDRQYTLKFVLQPLLPLVGQRVAIVGILMGDGGADGINVNTVTAIAPRCD